jgi:hypothetical protein
VIWIKLAAVFSDDVLFGWLISKTQNESFKWVIQRVSKSALQL